MHWDLALRALFVQALALLSLLVYRFALCHAVDDATPIDEHIPLVPVVSAYLLYGNALRNCAWNLVCHVHCSSRLIGSNVCLVRMLYEGEMLAEHGQRSSDKCLALRCCQHVVGSVDQRIHGLLVRIDARDNVVPDLLPYLVKLGR